MKKQNRKRAACGDMQIILSRQIQPSQNGFNLIQEFGKCNRDLSVWACIVKFRCGNIMSVPNTIQLIARVNALPVVDQNEIRRIETIIAIHLYKQPN